MFFLVVVGIFSWDWEAEPLKTDNINYGSRKKMVSSVYCRNGPWIGERGYGERIQNEQTQGQFQQETASEGDGTRERETK